MIENRVRAALAAMPEIAQVQAQLQKTKKASLTGVSGGVRAAAASLFLGERGPWLFVTSRQEQVREWMRELNAWLPEKAVQILYPELKASFQAEAHSLEVTAARMAVLQSLWQGKETIVLTTVEAFLQQIPGPASFSGGAINLTVGMKAARDTLLAELVKKGYERVVAVDARGQFSVRGGIVDIFSLNAADPIRLEWFDEELDSIRSFDPVSQRSLENLSETLIMPRFFSSEADSTILDHLPENGRVLLDEPTRLAEAATRLIKEEAREERGFWTWEALQARLQPYGCLSVSLLPHNQSGLSEMVNLTCRTLAPYHRQVELVRQDLMQWLQDGYTVYMGMSAEAKANAFTRRLRELNVPIEGPLGGDGVRVVVLPAAGGFICPEEKLAFVTETDIFGVDRRQRPQHAKQAGPMVRYVSDIRSGDYVVHQTHGIGRYMGVENLLAGDVRRDYLMIRYAGDDTLYVPVEQVQLLHKYIGAEGQTTRLSRMGGADWSRTRGRAKKAVTEMAAELLRLYAQRKLVAGHAFAPDTPWQTEFEDAFPYEPTRDQVQAIREIKADMEAPYPMDRLLCGDVGYGKTEVAIRAAFKAVMDGKQVAVLVPTTVLAQQHFKTFSERLAGFGPMVDMVSRFRTAKEQKDTLAKVQEGRVDILIGTHRLLNTDVLFKDLGLLVVDEEQRFGVAQKEKLKRWSTGIDVLTLSATPIPRTLHMSLAGARDMSTIDTPPEDRLPVETVVAEYHDAVVKEAILREVRRGGSVYYVHNRVQSIEKIAENLRKMMPELRILVGHGQMPEDMLERVMVDFYEHEADVLVCTSIIENGLDVSHANTIIIHNADFFGLSQLYQMRGRVGRTSRLAYAYFLYQRGKVISEAAEKRLQAIREFTELGSGFRIAMRDLEIRGAGNLLGSQQHGHIASIGFELYCRLLEETVRELNNQPAPEIEPEPLIEIELDAYLPDEYIEDAMHKLEIYRRLADVRQTGEAEDVLDELIDRFGNPPEPVQALVQLASFRGLCRRLGVRSVQQRGADVRIGFLEKSRVDPLRLVALVNQYSGRVTLEQGPPPGLRIKPLLVRGKSEAITLDWLTKQLTLLQAEG